MWEKRYKNILSSSFHPSFIVKGLPLVYHKNCLCVGGLGKTVVVQQFLNKLQNTPTEESQIEKIAWIPYDNHDIGCMGTGKASGCRLSDL